MTFDEMVKARGLHIYYDEGAISVMKMSMSPFSLIASRRWPRPWPMFCGQSLDNRPVKIIPSMNILVNYEDDIEPLSNTTEIGGGYVATEDCRELS